MIAGGFEMSSMLRAIRGHGRSGSGRAVTIAATCSEVCPRHRATAQIEEGSNDA